LQVEARLLSQVEVEVHSTAIVCKSDL